MILTAHNPIWATEFENLRRVYCAALGDAILRVEHVGSTAVPDLWAKPILDIDLVMEDYEVFPQIVAGLATLGYTHTGDQGILHREAFLPQDRTAPFTAPRRQWMPHHLYVCPAGSAELCRHIGFRDALRVRPDWRREYEAIKLDIAGRAGDDRQGYARIKEVECRGFVERVLGEWSNQTVQPTSPGAVANRVAPET